MQKVKNFFSSMFSGNSDVSSKRFNTFYALTTIVVLALIATFRSEDGSTPEFMYDALALIAGGGMGLTVVEKIFNKGPQANEGGTSEMPPIKCQKCGKDKPCGNCK